MNEEAKFPFAEVRKLLADCFEPKASIYYTDFLLSNTLGWVLFYIGFARLEELSALQLLTLTAAALLLYRAALFIHEIAHLKKGALPGFATVWNLLCGIPLFLPSFFYKKVHNDHHSSRTYGTEEDGEYLAMGAKPPTEMLKYFLSIFYAPILMWVRFIVLFPISLVVPPLRTLVIERLSALMIDFNYKRPPLKDSEKTEILLLETGSFVWGWFLLAMNYLGYLSVDFWIYFYCMYVAIFFLNTLRTYAAHRYRYDDKTVTMQEQMLDSVNVVGGDPLTQLIAPVGLRYHGLHHMYPTIPYHSLDRAHKLLLKSGLGGDLYAKTFEPTVFAGLRSLIGDSFRSETRLVPKKQLKN